MSNLDSNLLKERSAGMVQVPARRGVAMCNTRLWPQGAAAPIREGRQPGPAEPGQGGSDTMYPRTLISTLICLIGDKNMAAPHPKGGLWHTTAGCANEAAGCMALSRKFSHNVYG